MSKSLVVFTALALIASGASVHGATPIFDVTPQFITNTGGFDIQMNDAGQILSSNGSPAFYSSEVWTGTNSQVLNGTSQNAIYSIHGLRINSAGQVAGNSLSGPFWWEPSTDTMHFIKLIGSGQSIGSMNLTSFNDSGKMVININGGGAGPYLAQSNGTFAPITAPAGSNPFINDMDNPGHMVGRFTPTGSSVSHIAKWETNGSLTDLGSFGVGNSEATAVSPSGGYIIGSFTLDASNGTNDRAFIWTDGSFSEIPSPGGYPLFAESVSDNGIVVGRYRTADQQTRGFMYQAGTVYDLSSLVPGYTILDAYDINAGGQIVVSANNGVSNGLYILNPAFGGSVPEPASLAILGIGSLICLKKRR